MVGTSATTDPFSYIWWLSVVVPILLSLRKQLANRSSRDLESVADKSNFAVVPVRHVLAELRWLAGCKTLVLFFMFFFSYSLLSTIRVDWWKGSETLQWVQDAHDELRLKSIDKTETTAEVASMLEDGLPAVIMHLKSICVTCGVGLTPQVQDLAFLGLDSFICSDFDSHEGVNEYPRRDCVDSDADWAASPSSNSAPCCGNATLVRASIAMMVEFDAYGKTTLPLAMLLSGGSDQSFSSTEYFVEHYIDEHSFIMQVVVSQRSRMAAVQYHADWVDREDAPGRLLSSATFWSFNYQASDKLELLRIVTIAIGILTFVHDRRALLSALTSGQMPRAVQVLEESMADLYVTAVELPSTLLPISLEFCRPFLPLPTWTFWVTVCQMLMIARLFQDATIMPAFRRLVAVVKEAAPNILVYVLSLAPVSILTAVMQGQLFGAFDAGYADPWVALSRVIRMLTAPPAFGTIETEHYSATGGAAHLLYYWSTFVLRLAFGSIIVAILVGAFNKVLEREARRSDLALPPAGCIASNAYGPLTRMKAVALYVITSRSFGDFGSRTALVLEDHVKLIDSFDRSGERDEIMLGIAELDSLVGIRVARQLANTFGLRRPVGTSELASDALHKRASLGVSSLPSWHGNLTPLEDTAGDEMSLQAEDGAGSVQLASGLPRDTLRGHGPPASYGDPYSARGPWINRHMDAQHLC